MLTLFGNLIVYMEQLIKPIVFLFIVFIVNVAINYFREENKGHFFDEYRFGRKYIIAHGMACLFSIVFLSIFYFLPKFGSGVVAACILIVFYCFLIRIIMTQNVDNGGYIEDLDGASGSIMYITAILSPAIFIVIHALLGLGCFFFYKKEDNSAEWKFRIIKCGINCAEALIATIIVKIYIPQNFIDSLRVNVIMISIFTLTIPFVNDIIYYFLRKK